VMVCFAVLCVVAIGFVYKFLPETKGLSVEQAVGVYEREAEGGGALGRLSGTPQSTQAA
jgi:MFS transporter, SP family, arabinose:H+ symporter